MKTLKDLIAILEEIKNLDFENEKAQVYISGKYLFIRKLNQDDAYFIEL